MTDRDLEKLGASEEQDAVTAGSPAEKQPVFPQAPFTVPVQIPREVHESVPVTYSSPYRAYEAQVQPEKREDPQGNPVGDRAGFWPRLTAVIIDLLISAVLWLLFYLVVSIFTDRMDEPFFFSVKLITVLFYIAEKLYYILSQWKFGRTLGKRALRLTLVSSETYGKPDLWTVFFRETFGKFLSIISVIGSLMIFGKKHLPLHDRLADTEVVYSVNLPVSSDRDAKAETEIPAVPESEDNAAVVPEVVTATLQEIPDESAVSEEHSDEEVK